MASFDADFRYWLGLGKPKLRERWRPANWRLHRSHSLDTVRGAIRLGDELPLLRPRVRYVMDTLNTNTSSDTMSRMRAGLGQIKAGLRKRRQRRKASHWNAEDEARRRFYSQFISPGDIVFDVGANHGNRTKVFLRLEASVIAVEPQPACVAFLQSVFGRQPNLSIEATALGADAGEAKMMLSDETTISTLDEGWIDSVSSSGRFDRSMWSDSVTVPVTTLDRLIARHGVPAFLKIDVEGFEREVLAGLSQPVGALSLEFIPEQLDRAFDCLNRLEAIGAWEYQLSLGESMALAASEWISHADLVEQLQQVSAEQFGDIYARSV